jgi:hypothetical protein
MEALSRHVYIPSPMFEVPEHTGPLEYMVDKADPVKFPADQNMVYDAEHGVVGEAVGKRVGALEGKLVGVKVVGGVGASV